MSASRRAISAAEARRILSGAGTVAGQEEIALEGAAGRVLAEPLVAGEDVPSFPRSVMDGYAVRAADVAGASVAVPVSLVVAGAVLAGTQPTRAVAPGEAVAIPTGGYLPDGADAVIMIEHVEVAGSYIVVRRPAEAGRNIIRPGEDVRRGAEVLPAGRRLGAAEVAALAAFGRTQVPVFRRPRVAVLSTGSEICPPGMAPPPGKVRDVNQYALGAQARAAGCDVTHAGIVDDDPAAIEASVRALAAQHDVVVLSGGSSVGGRDHTPEVFARIGDVAFHGIAVRPGRPTLLARAGSVLLVGMPGVPTAAIVIFEVFIVPLLRRLGGETERARPGRRARLAAAHASEVGREDILRVRVIERDGETWAEVLAGGAAALSNVVAADGLVVVPAEVATVGAGEWVEVVSLR